MSLKRPFKAVPIKLGKRYRAQRRQRQLARVAFPVGVLALAAVAGAVVGVVLPAKMDVGSLRYDGAVTGCTVTDGDTIRCGGERIRLAGIDAPEMPGHCRQGRDCALGDPYVSTQSLVEAMSGTIHIERYGEDRYGRTLAVLSGNRGDLSCWQLEHRQAVYKPRWDKAARIIRTCPQHALFNMMGRY